ncbi:MAG: glycosyltransferase [Ignavibacteriales bacterium]|nr:glycosyltransferase [Ignavibacteriales bacterium]
MYKLSIVLPAYNGESHISQTLESITKQIVDNVELVVCDDRSTDHTYQIVDNYRIKYKNVRLFQNSITLGMDKNFERVADLAEGEFIWFIGQDDILDEGAVQKVLNVLYDNPQIDFIYANYSQKSHNLDSIIVKKMLDIEEDILCSNKEQFYSITSLKNLPGFLPSYILKKYWWDGVNKSPFYGTQFIQIGALLSVINYLNFYIIAHPYVIGRIPNDGWQQDTMKLLDIFSGELEVIKYCHLNYPQNVPAKLFKEYYSERKLSLINYVLLLRSEGRILNKKLDKRFKYLFGKRYLLLIALLLKLPPTFYKASRIQFLLRNIYKTIKM